jgi:hypothetical protein
MRAVQPHPHLVIAIGLAKKAKLAQHRQRKAHNKRAQRSREKLLKAQHGLHPKLLRAR